MLDKENLLIHQQRQQTEQPVQVLQHLEEEPQQEQALQNERQNQALQEEFQKLQTEQAAPGQAQLLQEEHENEMLAAQALLRAPAVHADGPAPGVPVQEQAPAKETFKQRRRDRKKDKAAREICPVGTAATYDMVKELQDRETALDNSTGPYTADIRRSGTDGRVIKRFCQGYRKDKNGRPMTKEDARKQREDREFIEDYCSGDLERRRRHLERIVREADYIRFPADPFSVLYMRYHISEMNDMLNKLAYLDNVKKDPINKAFFDNLDPILKDRLDSKELVGVALSSALVMSCAQIGVNLNSAVYIRYGEEAVINSTREAKDINEEGYRNALRDYRRDWGEM